MFQKNVKPQGTLAQLRVSIKFEDKKDAVREMPLNSFYLSPAVARALLAEAREVNAQRRRQAMLRRMFSETQADLQAVRTMLNNMWQEARYASL